EGDVRAGDKVGTITFKQRNEEIATLDLVACEDLDAPDFFEGVGVWWERLLRGFSGQPQSASAVTLNETPLVVDNTAAGAASREDNAMTTLCPVCSNPVESDAAACPQCGFKLLGATQRFEPVPLDDAPPSVEAAPQARAALHVVRGPSAGVTLQLGDEPL